MDSYPAGEPWSSQHTHFDSSNQWTYLPVRSPESPVSQPLDLPEHRQDFYSGLDGSLLDSMSPSSSDISYRSSPRRRGLEPPKIIAQMQKAIPAKVERRREQNRSSQRAYRERKEKRQKELEEQIAKWQHEHRQLYCSYREKAEEVDRLRAEIAKLTGELSTLRSDYPPFMASFSQEPADFDLVPFYDFGGQPSQSAPSVQCSSR